MATQSVDALTSVAWMFFTFVPVHDALLAESKISTVAPEAANSVLTLPEKVCTCVVAFVDVVLTILTLPSWNYFRIEEECLSLWQLKQLNIPIKDTCYLELFYYR